MAGSLHIEPIVFTIPRTINRSTSLSHLQARQATVWQPHSRKHPNPKP